jgi:hypothetical protein
MIRPSFLYTIVGIFLVLTVPWWVLIPTAGIFLYMEYWIKKNDGAVLRTGYLTFNNPDGTTWKERYFYRADIEQYHEH